MKNVLDYSLGEIAIVAECQSENQEARLAVECLTKFLAGFQDKVRAYQVQAVQKKIETKQTPTPRRCRSIDSDLLESCVLVPE